MYVGLPYWIRHFEFRNFEFRFRFWVLISDRKKCRIPSFIRIKLFFTFKSAILDPPFWISEFWVQICYQRLQNFPSTEFHSSNYLFTFWSAILNFWILSSVSLSATPKSPEYRVSFIKLFIYISIPHIGSAILNFWILNPDS